MYDDLSRPPLHAASLARGIVYEGSLWRELRLLATSPSTNAEVAAAARDGAPEGLVLVAEHQLAGRGRLDRAWVTPARAALTFSVLLRPGIVPMPRWGLLPLLAGMSLLRAVRRLSELPVTLKWPNDLMVNGGKAAGLLAEVVGSGADAAVVLGIGLNVSTRRDELPVDTATSLAIEGSACTDRDPLLRAVLRELELDYTGWRSGGGDPVHSGLLEAYAACCDTLGRTVTVTLPAGTPVIGVAEGVDSDGRLVVRTSTGPRSVAAGDVTHVRTAD